MKLTHIIGLLAVLVLITAQGCQKAEKPEVTVPEISSEEPAPVAEPEAPQQVEEAPVGADVRILKGGFDPETATISQGGTVTWKNADEKVHLLVMGDKRSPRLSKGDVWAVTFEEPGTYEVMDAIFKFKGTVVVEIK